MVWLCRIVDRASVCVGLLKTLAMEFAGWNLCVLMCRIVDINEEVRGREEVSGSERT